LLLLAALYAVGYGSLLVYTDFLPYVFDNNESFSAFVHGSNLYHFGVEKSFGLTDEAYGPDPAAHPYVYTHQGNFPRLVAFLMYAAGVRTVEGQIALSTFTVGLATIGLIYLFFTRLVGRCFGITTALLFMSDYVLSAQWLVNTFKVWHGFLLFAMLLLIQQFNLDRRNRWLIWLAGASVCVGYFDLLMAVFTFVLCSVFAVALSGRRILQGFVPVVAMFVGAVASVCILLAQLIAYYGLEGLRQDLYLTFVGRNYLANDPAALRAWQEFFVNHRIVFWEALVDSKPFANLASALKSIFQYGFSVLTPYFSFLLFALVGCAAMTTLLRGALRSNRVAIVVGTGLATLLSSLLGTYGAAIALLFAGLLVAGSSQGKRSDGKGVARAAIWLVWFGINFLLAVICFTDAVEGHPARMRLQLGIPDMAGILVAVGLVGAAVFVPLTSQFITSWLGDGRQAAIRSYRLAAAGAYAALLAAVALGQHTWLDLPESPMASIWDYVMGPWVQRGASKLFVLVTAGLGVLTIAKGWRLAPYGDDRRIMLFLLAALTGYMAAYFFSPGYMVLINLKRYVPILVFFLLPFAAFAMCILMRLLTLAGRAAKSRLTNIAVFAMASLAAIHVLVYWIGVQATYIELIPPDQAYPLSKLDKPPYAGETFTVNHYAAPVAAKTGTWAYINQFFVASGEYRLDPDGYKPDGKDIYRWFADRENPKYDFPSYVFCFDMPGFHHALQALQILRSNRDRHLTVSQIYRRKGHDELSYTPLIRFPFACAGAFSSRRLDDADEALLRLILVDSDPSFLTRWSIYRLEHDFPPYVASGDQAPVKLQLERRSGACIVRVAYAYRQQQSKPESGTLMRAWLQKDGDASNTSWLYEGPAVAELPIPAGTRGRLLVFVEPATSTRRGWSVSSEPFPLADC